MSLATSIERAYGIKISQFARFKDVYKIHTNDRRDLCLKPFSVPEQEVQFIVGVMQHLRRSGFQSSPRVFETEANTSSTRFGSKRYVLTNWVNGRRPLFSRRQELLQGVRTLARFHQFSVNLNLSNTPPDRERGHQLPELPKDARGLICKHIPARQASHLLAQCDLASELFQSRDVQIAMLREHRVQAFVHGDYNYPNLIRDKSGRIRLIDFDNTSLQPRMEDLAHIIHRNAPWNGQKAMRLIEAYDHVRPLTKRDLHLLLSLLSVPYPLVRAIRQIKSLGIRHVRRTTPEAVKVKQFLKWIERRFTE